MSCRHPQTQGGYPMSKHEELIKSLRASAAAMPFDAAVAVQYRAAADALEAQAREIEGLRKDAARYRWLREHRIIDLHANPSVPWVVRCEFQPIPTTTAIVGEALNAAIDVARKQGVNHD